MIVFCLICQEDIHFCHEEISVVNCGHLFHKKCLQKWLDTNSTCPECKSAVTINDFVQNIYPSKKEESDFMLNKLSEETENLVKISKTENIQKMLTERINTLEEKNLKLIEENSRLKIENERLKNHNQLKKDSELLSLKTEKNMTPWLNIIKNEENLNIEKIDNTSSFYINLDILFNEIFGLSTILMKKLYVN